MSNNVKCIIHGSFKKYFDLIKDASQKFSAAGIKVIAPEISDIVGETDGFIHLASDKSSDPRVTELLYLKKILELGPNGFSYYVNPEGNLGVSASYELGIDQLTNTRCLFMKPLRDHPAYIPENSVWNPNDLADYISENNTYPPPVIPQEEHHIQNMVNDLIMPGSVIAVGGIIVDYSDKRYHTGQERDILLVKTHKWQGKYSVVGGRVKKNETLTSALKREISEETGLESDISENICTFDEMNGAGYFIPGTHRVFTDNIINVNNRNVQLNYEAEDFLWIPPSFALRDLDIESNAKRTLELYNTNHRRIA